MQTYFIVSAQNMAAVKSLYCTYPIEVHLETMPVWQYHEY